MSADSPNTTTQQTTTGATASEIETFFNSVEARSRREPRLHTESGVCQFTVTGVGTWLISVKDGVPSLIRDATDAPKPDTTFTSSPDVLVRILHREGHLNAMAATLQGLLVVRGNPALAMQVLGGA